MRCLRLALHSLLALVLFAQSLGAAAAPRSLAQPQEIAGASVGASMPSMPCHGASEPTAPKADCCNAGCPDMLTCAFAAVVLSSSLPQLNRPAASEPPLLAVSRTAAQVVPASLFRPPISPAA